MGSVIVDPPSFECRGDPRSRRPFGLIVVHRRTGTYRGRIPGLLGSGVLQRSGSGWKTGGHYK